MGLVQGDFERACDDLHAAGQALRRRVDESQRVGRKAAIVRDLADDGWRRRTGALQHQRRLRGPIRVAELLEQRLAARERATRAGTEREELFRPGAVREPPARILAGKAGDHRIRRAADQRPRPVGRDGGKLERDAAEPAHADLGDTQARRDAARMRAAGVDQQFAERAARHADLQRLGIRDESLDQRGGTRVHADGVAHVLALVHRRTVASLSSTNRLASVALGAEACTVHKGSPALIALPACGRSAVQSGQSRAGMVNSLSA